MTHLNIPQEPETYLEEISNFIFFSRYSRYNEKLGRRETWDEAVTRLENMHLKKYAFLSKEDKEKIKWAFGLVRAKRVVPSMRSLQFGGKAIEAHHSRNFNCSVRHIDSLRSFAEIMYLLLCGCGVGIGVTKFFLKRLPDLVDANDKTGTIITYVVEDDIEGWADSVEALLCCYFKNTPYTGRKVVFDYSRIRKKGTPLKTGGGRAPGYKGLKRTHQKIKALLDYIIENQGVVRLRPIHAYDILMHCSDAVLSGGIRRSATIVIFDKDETEMIKAKTMIKVSKKSHFEADGQAVVGGKTYQLWDGKVTVDGLSYEVKIKDYEYEILKKEGVISWIHIHPQRGRSNNSVLLLRKDLEEEEFRNIFEQTKQYGEPGFIFADHPWFLVNPCQPSFASVLTKRGISAIGKVEEGDFIWSETGWTKIIKKWKTGIKPVYKYITSAGFFIGTENHRIVSSGIKIEVADAASIDILCGPYNNFYTIDPQDVMDGLVLGDGSVHKASNNKIYLCIGENDEEYFNSEISNLIKGKSSIGPTAYEVITTLNHLDVCKTYEREIPDRFLHNPNKLIGLLRGLYSANGSCCRNRITFKTTSPKLRDGIQIALSSLGISSYFTTNKPTSVKFKNGEYVCKESYDININGDRKKFLDLIGFIQTYKENKIYEVKNIKKQFTYEIKEIQFLGELEVFEITVDNESHTYWTGGLNVSNCGEASFVPVTKDGVCGVQFCNLVSQNGRLIKDLDTFRENCEACSIIGTLQAGYTHFPYLNKASEELTREEALLGCSITGLMDSPNILLNPKNLEEMAKVVVETNKIWAKKININPSARTTCIKPEGTSSLVLGTSSGVHPHHSYKYFRRVQCNTDDPVYKLFKKTNPKLCEKSVWSANNTDDIVTFPIQVSQEAKTKKDFNALQHLEIIKKVHQSWVKGGASEYNQKPAMHSVSCTVIVVPDEWEKVAKYLYDNRYDFTSVSFLPSSGDKDYTQAPMESVVTQEDEKHWEEITKNFQKVDYTQLKEEEDNTNLSQEMACFGGACQII